MSLPVSDDIKLGGISLSPNLVLMGLRVSQVAVNQWRTKAGKLKSLTNMMSGGRQLELKGWYTTGQIDSLQALEGQWITLVHPRLIAQVMIIDNNLQMLHNELVDPAPDDIEEGSIILLER